MEDLQCGAFKIAAKHLEVSFARSSGPGGQNVNKVSSKVDLRFDLVAAEELPFQVRERLRAIAKLDADGRVVVVSQKTRDQHKNIADALDKLRALIFQASFVPKARRKTKPTRSSQRRRLDEKKVDANRKEARSKSWKSDH